MHARRTPSPAAAFRHGQHLFDVHPGTEEYRMVTAAFKECAGTDGDGLRIEAGGLQS